MAYRILIVDDESALQTGSMMPLPTACYWM